MKHTLPAIAASVVLAGFAANATVQQRTPHHPIAERIERSRTVPINGRFTFPLERNCRYTAEVHGTARPSGTSSPQGERLYSASGTVSAAVNCPGRTSIRGTERLSTRHPETLAAIEQAIETRGTLVKNVDGRRCAYVPNFTLSASRLDGVGAALMCPAPVQEPMRGGGPTRK